MKKKILFSLVLVVLLFSLAGVSAYHGNYGSDGTRFVFDFGRGDFYSQDYKYVDYYGIPIYKVYAPRSGRSDDFLEELNKRKAIRFAVNSFNNRYKINVGQSSGNSFCNGCSTNGVSSNWGNKPTYNFLADGRGAGNSYYYEPRYDSQLGYYNWRY